MQLSGKNVLTQHPSPWDSGWKQDFTVQIRTLVTIPNKEIIGELGPNPTPIGVVVGSMTLL